MNLKQFLETTNQEEFAKVLGVTQGAISHWMTGRTRIAAERVIEIEKATGGLVSRHELRPDIYPIDQAA